MLIKKIKSKWRAPNSCTRKILHEQRKTVSYTWLNFSMGSCYLNGPGECWIRTPVFYSYHEEQLTGRQWIPMHAGVCVVVQQCLMGKRDHVCLNKGGLFLPGRPVETLGSCLNLTWLSPSSSLSFSFAYSRLGVSKKTEKLI